MKSVDMGHATAQECRAAVKRREHRRGARLQMAVIAVVLGAILGGCVVAPAPGYYAYRGPGWCYYHPYRC